MVLIFLDSAVFQLQSNIFINPFHGDFEMSSCEQIMGVLLIAVAVSPSLQLSSSL